MRGRRQPVTAARLAEALEVSERTIYRDVAELMAQGAPIEGEAGVGYILRPGLFLPPLMLSEDEVEAVMLGLHYVDQRGDDVLRPGCVRRLDENQRGIVASGPGANNEPTIFARTASDLSTECHVAR